ncbi:hypothetical protein MKX01_042315, partial [Papaver californicum]
KHLLDTKDRKILLYRSKKHKYYRKMPAMNDYPSSSSYNFSSSSSLHSVRKISSKPWKKPVPSQQLPPQIRVYCVESSNFRKVVQELTGATKIQPNRLRHLAPPPINIIKPSPQQQFDHTSSQQMQQQLLQQPQQQQQQQQQPQQQLEAHYEQHHDQIPLEADYDIDFSSPEPLVKVSNESLFGSSNSPSFAAALTSIGLMSPTTWNTWCSAAPSPLLSPGSMFALFGV